MKVTNKQTVLPDNLNHSALDKTELSTPIVF